MATGKALQHAADQHMRPDEGETTSATPRCGSPLYAIGRMHGRLWFALTWVALSAVGADFVWDGDDTSSWKNPASYRNNSAAALPGPNDTVTLPRSLFKAYAIVKISRKKRTER